MLRQSALLISLAIGCSVLCTTLYSQEEWTLADDFTDYEEGSDGFPRWETDLISWEVRDGAYHVDGTVGGFAQLSEGPMYRRVVVEATVTLQEAVTKEWKIASVCVLQDARNYWHFALVEAPRTQGEFHFEELAESRDGAWLAQGNLQGTADENCRFDWEYGVSYRLRIAMTPDGIEGTLLDMDGQAIARQGYAFSDVAVTSGYLALRCSGFVGNFDDVKVTASDPLPRPEVEPPTYPAYDVAASDLLLSRATGFFRTYLRDGVWWVIDPRGRPFYAIGTDHCRFSGHWCEKLGYAPYGRNMEEKFGTPEAWAVNATARLKDWGFNLTGAGGGEEAFYQGLAHTRFISFGSGFAGVSDICPRIYWTGFPNVFHPKWPQYCDRRARDECAPHKNDPWLFGYFLDNELEWYGKSHTEWGLFDEAMKKDPDHTAKLALVEFMRERYATIDVLNEAWGTSLRSFDGILRRHSLDGSNVEQVRRDKNDFVRLCAEKYFQTCADAIRKHDPNHMVIGCRFAGDAPARIWDIAGRHSDIVSFNFYGSVDLEKWEAPGLVERFTEYYETAQKPLMMTEWSFPALDSGLPCEHGAGQRFDTQEQRAQAFEIYQTMLFRLPFMVGSDFFMWVDEPALGISKTFPEDTNYGLVNEQDVPYAELTTTAERVNQMAYTLHSQQYPEIEVDELTWADELASVTVRNTGKADAEVLLRSIVDGQEHDRTVRVQAAEARVVSVPADLQPGGHLLLVEADPEHTLHESNVRDNRAIQTVHVRHATQGEDDAVARVTVANLSSKPLDFVPVTAQLGLLAGGFQSMGPLVAEGRGAEAKPVQIDGAPAELVFIGDPLPPWGCQTYRLTTAREAPKGKPVKWRDRYPGFAIDNDVLGLATSRRGGDFFDAIELNGTMIGRYNPLIWQEVDGQNYWVRTSEFVGADFVNGPARLVADLTARGGPGEVITRVDEEGRQEEQTGQPVPFEVTHQVIVYPGQNWFQTKFLRIRNVGDEPLTLRGYFFYLTSELGGDATDDVPASPKVPNYYAPFGAAWKDEPLSLWLGAIPQEQSDLRVSFWLDEGGGQHPDARRQFEEPIVLAPGETYAEENAPWLYVYAGSGDAPWKAIKRLVQGLSALQVEVW